MYAYIFHASRGFFELADVWWSRGLLVECVLSECGLRRWCGFRPALAEVAADVVVNVPSVDVTLFFLVGSLKHNCRALFCCAVDMAFHASRVTRCRLYRCSRLAEQTLLGLSRLCPQTPI